MKNYIKQQKKEYIRYLNDFIANDGIAKLKMELIGSIEDITNLSISMAKYNLYIKNK